MVVCAAQCNPFFGGAIVWQGQVRPVPVTNRPQSASDNGYKMRPRRLASERQAVLGCPAVAQHLVSACPPPGCASWQGGPVRATDSQGLPSDSRCRTSDRAKPVGTLLAHSSFPLAHRPPRAVQPLPAAMGPRCPRRGQGRGELQQDGFLAGASGFLPPPLRVSQKPRGRFGLPAKVEL
jgi:hypothetical protein